MSRKLEKMNVWFGLRPVFPDPSKIAVVGDWYFLDHVSSGLIGYDHVISQFQPLLAETADSHKSKIHTFTLRENARFHDGTSITSEDVVSSIKRLLIKKTATHFPLWDYIEGCENLSKLSEECSGLIAINERTVQIRLKSEADSFFLQMASPETGIWSHADIDPVTLDLRATKFSGPYFVRSFSEAGAHLKENPYSPINQKFPDAPKEIFISLAQPSELDGLLESGALDLVVRGQRPFDEKDWHGSRIQVFDTSPAALVYLYSTTHKSGVSLVSERLLKEFWNQKSDQAVIAAKTFLPFGRDYALTEEEVFSLLPESGFKKVRIAVITPYFSEKLIAALQLAGENSGNEIEIIRINRDEWMKSYTDPEADQKYDFVLTPYAASERYPAVQLRYITGSEKKPPIDLKKAEAVDLTPERISILKEYQRWLLQNQHAIPLYFIRNLLLFSENLDIGQQSVNDAEIELWRVKKR